jgi:hypothetical protein
MPNIEIHGFDHSVGEEAQAQQVRLKIESLFQDPTPFPDFATEIVYSICRSGEGDPLPYLRVWDTDDERGRRITKILHLNGFHVERPVKLAEYAEPAMWNEKEIMADLRRMLSNEWLQGTVTGTQLTKAIENLERREYLDVANFYILVLNYYRSLLDWLPTRVEVLQKSTFQPANASELDTENGRKARFIVVLQIIDSLVPEWARLDLYALPRQYGH